MAKVHILNVTVHNNPAPFFTPFQFEINFECLEELQDDLEFKIIYVGSAETVEFDQTLDQIVVDAVPKGQFKFMFQADPPDTSKIPADDAVGVTVVLITASYRDQEFVRVGYYVNNEYEDPELRENPPSEPQFDKLIRQIASDQPRVTKFKINWDSSSATTDSGAATATTSTSGESTATTATAPPPATQQQAEASLLAMMNSNTQDSEMVDISNISAKNSGDGASSDLKQVMNSNNDVDKENINENLSQMDINDPRRNAAAAAAAAH